MRIIYFGFSLLSTLFSWRIFILFECLCSFHLKGLLVSKPYVDFVFQHVVDIKTLAATLCS
jgi:hypothetical protein